MENSITMIKYQGLGNDYLVLDPNKNRVQLQGKKIALLCQRGFGLGADGVLYGPVEINGKMGVHIYNSCLLYTSPSPRDRQKSRMPSSA